MGRPMCPAEISLHEGYLALEGKPGQWFDFITDYSQPCHTQRQSTHNFEQEIVCLCHGGWQGRESDWCRVLGRRWEQEVRGELLGGHTGHQLSPDRDWALEPPFKAFQKQWLANCLLPGIPQTKTLTESPTDLPLMMRGICHDPQALPAATARIQNQPRRLLWHFSAEQGTASSSPAL